MPRVSLYTGIFLLLLLPGLLSCKHSYLPPSISAPKSYLVVEGTIATGNTDSTVIKLSHTVKLSDSTATDYELNAQVSIQNGVGQRYDLPYRGNGSYGAASLNLPSTGRYRIYIKRSDGNIYIHQTMWKPRLHRQLIA